MNYRYLLCRSQSEAIAIHRRLTGCGVSSQLARPPRSAQVRSCAWAICIDGQDVARTEACLLRSGISRSTWCWEGEQ